MRAAVVLIALGALGCSKDGGDQAGKAPPGRFDVAKTKPKKTVSVDELCDVRPAAGAGPALTWPALSGEAPAGGRLRWINLWATWCKPCLEEMPMLRRFHDDMTRAGAGFELAFVSVDVDDEVVARFRGSHPEVPPGPRLARADDLPGFMKAIGLDESAPIPVHIFVGPDDKIRCVRAGGLREPDLEAVREILR